MISQKIMIITTTKIIVSIVAVTCLRVGSILGGNMVDYRRVFHD